MSSQTYGLDWPDGFPRTDSDDRESTNKFRAGYGQTKRELRRELERMGVDDWYLDEVSGSGGDPGIVVRWRRNGIDHAVACDRYTSKTANAREAYLWIQETRKRSDRPVETGQDAFAAAQLPPGDDDPDMVVAGAGRREPHDVLNVAPDADPAVIRGAFRELVKEAHQDSGGRVDLDVDEIRKARDAMLEDKADA